MCGYVKKSFLEGRSFTDLSGLNHQVDAWVDTVANVRIHGTTGTRPIDRYAKEAPALCPFASVPAYDTRPVELRVVASDSHISFGGVRYSVHPIAVGHTVEVRPEGGADRPPRRSARGDAHAGSSGQPPRTPRCHRQTDSRSSTGNSAESATVRATASRSHPTSRSGLYRRMNATSRR